MVLRLRATQEQAQRGGAPASSLVPAPSGQPLPTHSLQLLIYPPSVSLAQVSREVCNVFYPLLSYMQYSRL